MQKASSDETENVVLSLLSVSAVDTNYVYILKKIVKFTRASEN